MPRYFFNVVDGDDIPDYTGTVLPNEEAARLEAMISSTAIIADLGVRFWGSTNWQMRVVDEGGTPVVTLVFSGTVVEPGAGEPIVSEERRGINGGARARW